MPRPIPIEEMVSVFKRNHKTAHLIKIDNFSLLLKEYKIDPITSSVFHLGGQPWKLLVYANGYKNGNEHVSVYLENQASLAKTFSYRLFVVSQTQKKRHSPVGIRDFGPCPPKTRQGVSKLVSPYVSDPEEENEFFIGDCCMIGVKFHGLDDEQTFAECFSLIKRPPNHKVTWMITKFSSFDPYKPHHSNEFVVGNRKWKIEIHPRGFESEKDKSLSVYLLGEGFINNAPKTEVFAKFKLRLLNQENRNDHHWEECTDWFDTDEGIGIGSEDFMPLEELVEPFLVKDRLYVGVEFEVISVTNYC